MIHIKKIFITFAMAGLLSGCAGMNSDFACPMQPGVMCKSLDQVNSMVDHGQIGNNCAVCTQAANNANNLEVRAFANNRSTNSVRIWIAPFTDNEKNYHEASVLYNDSASALTTLTTNPSA